MSIEEAKPKEVPNIDLNNFDDPSFVASRYVLTSPRSLEACANMNIKPVDLLPKSKEEFQREHRNFGKKKMETLFGFFEKERREKLLKVRLERIRLIKQEDPQNAVSSQQHLTHPNGLSFERSNSQPSKLSFSPRQYSAILNKLCPKDVKRIKLAEERYRMGCPRMRNSAPNQRLVVTGRVCFRFWLGQDVLMF
ncbi:hypothetical protein FGIG_12448 [Fasciola gigantica]|uniref:Uncharacterized protein n=1 Tax=Fasciola gigantica TaxID=46835 RepID=A0A504YZI1_FASGI|nr:hypothetical protein FGIG_12448 [Fasciola gigantica]